MRIEIPAFCLVALIGPSGCGKSTFAARHFAPTEVLSSDRFRGMITDDEADQSASAAAFECLYLVAKKRLEAGRLTVIDATCVRREARAALARIARERGCPLAAIAFAYPLEVCLRRNALREGRVVPPAIVRRQHGNMERGLDGLAGEGFDPVCVLRDPDEAEGVEIARV